MPSPIRPALAGLLAALLLPAAASAAPTATFSYTPSAPVAGQAVSFAAPASTCDVTPCTYTWSDDGPDGPGGVNWPLGTGRTLSYTFTSAGTKYVRLRVRNVAGASATTMRTITVATAPSAPAPAPAPTGCTVTTAAQMQARAADSPGQVCTVSGNIGSVTLSARPSSVVTFRGDGTASFANVTFDGAANIVLDRARVTGGISFPDRSGRTHGSNIVLNRLVVGGTRASRSTAAALLSVRGGNDRITLQQSELAWTLAGNTGNAGYAIRALNGNGEPINGLNIINNKIHHIGADGAQLAGVAALRFERNEIAYVAPEPGSSEHSDSLQIMSLEGTAQAKILRNNIHHVGFFDENAVPADSYPAGQLLIHGWSDVPVLFQDNLVRENRNYSPMFKSESDGSVADNWTFDHNTILRQGPPQPSSDRAGYFLGRHVLTNNILARYEGTATFTSASGNVVRSGSVPGGVKDSSLQFSSTWLSTDHPTAGIRQAAGPSW